MPRIHTAVVSNRTEKIAFFCRDEHENPLPSPILETGPVHVLPGDTVVIQVPMNERGDRPLVIYIAGPYSAPTLAERETNTRRAMDVFLALLARGHYPICPHLSHYPHERHKALLGAEIPYNVWIELDRQYLVRCDAIYYMAPSPGADDELRLARKCGKIVFENMDEVPDLTGSEWWRGLIPVEMESGKVEKLCYFDPCAPTTCPFPGCQRIASGGSWDDCNRGALVCATCMGTGSRMADGGEACGMFGEQGTDSHVPVEKPHEPQLWICPAPYDYCDTCCHSTPHEKEYDEDRSCLCDYPGSPEDGRLVRTEDHCPACIPCVPDLVQVWEQADAVGSGDPGIEAINGVRLCPECSKRIAPLFAQSERRNKSIYGFIQLKPRCWVPPMEGGYQPEAHLENPVPPSGGSGVMPPLPKGGTEQGGDAPARPTPSVRK